MRPNMLFSLLSSLVYNYSIGNLDVSLFEVGKIYENNRESENLSSETNSIGFIFSGNKIESGFGIVKPIKYDFYDLVSYLKSIFDRFNMSCNFDLKPVDYLKNCYQIVSNNKNIGYLGIVVKSKFSKILPNIKLVKNKVFYCELNLEEIKYTKKVLKFESSFPSIIRQYNFICSKKLSFIDIFNYINNFDNSINEILVKDVYEDSNMNPEEHSVLVEIKYRLESRTLSAEEIEKLEKNLLENLSSKFEIKIKE